MSSAEKILALRKSLLLELGHEPLLSEIARRVGLTGERVRQVYAANGLDTRAALNQQKVRTREKGQEKAALLEAKKAERLELYLSIATALADHPELTTKQIGQRFGVEQVKASSIGTACGLRRIKSTRRRGPLFTVDEWTLLARGVAEGVRSKQLAMSLDCSVTAVNNARQFLPLRRAWQERHGAITEPPCDAL